MIVHKEQIVLERFPDLPEEVRTQIVDILGHAGLEANSLCNGNGTLTVPQFVQSGAGKTNLAPALGRVIGYVEPWRLERKKKQTQIRRQYPIKIDFEETEHRARRLAALIEENLERVVSILLDQESYEVVGAIFCIPLRLGGSGWSPTAWGIGCVPNLPGIRPSFSHRLY